MCISYWPDLASQPVSQQTTAYTQHTAHTQSQSVSCKVEQVCCWCRSNWVRGSARDFDRRAYCVCVCVLYFVIGSALAPLKQITLLALINDTRARACFGRLRLLCTNRQRALIYCRRRQRRQQQTHIALLEISALVGRHFRSVACPRMQMTSD